MGRKGGGGKVLMALGIVLALVSGGIVFFLANTATAAPTETPMTEVVVATKEIPQRTVITAADVRLNKLPTASLPPGAVLKVDDIVGKFAREKIRAQSPVVVDAVASTGKPDDKPPATAPAAPAPGAKPAPKLVDAAFTLDKGKVMVAVDYPEAAKLVAAGVLRPGNKVDMYVKTPGANGDQIARIFSNLEIKAIGTLAQTEEATASPTLIFVTSPQDALVLKFLETMNPFFILRAAGDDQEIRTDLVTIDYLIARFGLQRPLR